MREGQGETAADRIVRLIGQATAAAVDPSPPGFKKSVKAHGKGAFAVGRDFHLFINAGGSGAVKELAEDGPDSAGDTRSLLVDLIELCGSQLGDRLHYLPHMVLTYGTSRIDGLSDTQLRDLADWAFRRCMGRGLSGGRQTGH